jgi:hypothetical protein
MSLLHAAGKSLSGPKIDYEEIYRQRREQVGGE